MDDVDQIVLSSLKEIGYELKDEIVNLKLCPFEDMVEMTIRCLNAIKPDLNLPTVLPPSMSVKYNMCNQLANICKELGYKGEVGYHTFLYTNVSDVRNLLIYLVQFLPRQDTFQEVEKDEDEHNVTIKQKTIEELKKALSSKSKEYYGLCSTPFISTSLETGTLLPNQKIDCQPLEWRDFVVDKLPFIDEQVPDYQYFLPSLISLNSHGILNPKKPKRSSFNFRPLEESFFDSVNSRRSSQSDNSSVSRDELTAVQAVENGSGNILTNSAIESEALDLESSKETELVVLEKEIENMKENVSTLKFKLKDITQSNDEMRKKLDEKIAQESTIEQSLRLLPDSENNIPKLLSANEKVRNKLKKYEIQWEQGKEELLKRKTELKEILSVKTNEKNQLVQNILELRKELFSVAEQIEKKKTLQQKLAESDKLKGVQRNEYIQRIFEIIKSIKKQGLQIDQILVDIRGVQKEINTLTGKISRSFALAEQMIVSTSKNDDFSQETHKLLLSLHRDISDILTMTGETGNYSRESKDLEEQLQETESSENILEALEGVRSDLQRIKEEEASMLKKIHALEKKQKKPLPEALRLVTNRVEGDKPKKENHNSIDNDSNLDIFQKSKSHGKAKHNGDAVQSKEASAL